MAVFRNAKNLEFPDHNDPNFDDSIVITHNGVDYQFNGFGWEIVCGEGGYSGQEYDDQWIKDDQKRQDEELEELKESLKCEPETWTVSPNLPVDGEIHFNSLDLINLPESTFGMFKVGEALVIEGERCTITYAGDHLQGNPPDQYWSIKAAVPDHIKQLSEVTIDLCDTSDYVTRYEFETDQHRQDELNLALDALIEAEVLALNKKFDEDQKRQDDALEAEIDARNERDTLHDAQINTIEYKLDALVGLQFKGTYEFKHEADCNAAYEACVADCWANDPNDTACRTQCGKDQVTCEQDKVRPGYFEAVDPDDQFDHLEYIVISKSDKAGVEIDWAGVLDEGDYLEVDHVAQGVLDKTNYGLYRITEEPQHGTNSYGEDVYTIRVQFLQGDGVMNVRENYEIRGITAAEGVNPEELGDFLTKEEAAATYALKTHTHAWAEITGKPSSYNPSSHNHSASNITSGTLALARIPTGTTSTTVSLGNHTHSGYASSTHTHSNMAIMKITTSSSPSLNTGEMAWNKNTYTLYIGK